MEKVQPLVSILGVKGLISLVCITTVVLALVVYSADININPTQQFYSGSISASWTIYVNDVDEVRYLPGSGTPAGATQPTFDPGDPDDYAFNVVTDAAQVCAIQLELTATVDNTKFSKFQITALRWDSVGSSWVAETLYDAATGSTSISYIDGLTGETGYIHQTTDTTEYYAITVMYSYDLVETTTQVDVTIQYTPLPQDSF